MSVKNLFNKNLKVLANKSLDDFSEDIESADFIKRAAEKKNQFIPRVDFSFPKNFARFGSAEKYYEDAITRIHNGYPYDGSKKEKIEWHLSSSYFDTYLFENEYPRTNGYALFSPTGWGTRVDMAGDYGDPDTDEFIQVKGGPNKDLSNTQLSKIYPSDGGTANLYDTSENRESNLKFDLQTSGVTVEFWLKKDAFTPVDGAGVGNTNKEVIFDLWNGRPSSSADYGRLTVEISGTSVVESPFYLTAQSGTAGFFNQQIGSSIAGTGSLAAWKHYAISFVNSANAASGVDVKFYVNGDLNQSTTLGSTTLGEVTGSLIANIGALRASPSGSTFIGTSMEGWGKLSGSIDEFRYWKTRRSSQKIGRYWFTQVGAGTNTDTANTTLGVYYKFNEGIVGSTSADSIVLDYSGRVSNGEWTGYQSEARSIDSAMVLAGAAATEFKDPILNMTHPTLIQFIVETRQKGHVYDQTNNSAIFGSMPDWIQEDDGENGNLRKLTQIISSYFDTLYLQAEALPGLHNVEYGKNHASSSYKPLPFADALLGGRGLIVPEIFSNATVLEYFGNRDEDRDYEESLSDIKNTIYQNIYNNLSYIFKSKGTEKGLRNLIRCYGVDDELIKINLYANNYTYTFEDNYRAASVRNSYADFNSPDRFGATVHQFIDSGNPNATSFISASVGARLEENLAVTVEAEILFPEKFSKEDVWFFDTSFTAASLFGMHTADTTVAAADTTTAIPDVANFNVFSEKREANSSDVRFRLTSSAGGFFPDLASGFFPETYNNERWVLAVRVFPTKFPNVGQVNTGSAPDTYTINFYGVNVLYGDVKNEFEVTGTVSYSQGLDILTNPKRLFAGAQRQNLTGSLTRPTDVKVGSCRVFYDYIPNESIKMHAVDPTNFGTRHPYRDAFLYENDLRKSGIVEAETLALNWTFETVTGSNAAGQFLVPDLSSGSVDLQNRHGWISKIINLQHPGRGFGFPPDDINSVDKDYIFAYRQQLPEILTSEDTVKVLTQDDLQFTRESRPQTFFFALEKSMYQEISIEMLNLFSTVKDFGNLVGEPVNRYRQDYKDLSKLRQLYFEKVQNTPDFEKFVEFYKWFDESLNVFLQQFLPASADVSEEIKTVFESHILERNKYWTKFPTLEVKESDPDAGFRGVNELTYDWKTGHAPISDQENENCSWWNARAEREGIISSGDVAVDTDRGQILQATLSVLNRKFTTPHRFLTNRSLKLHSGINLPTNKRPDVSMINLQPSTSETIDITLDPLPDCIDGLNSPTRYGKKIRIPLIARGGMSGLAKSGDTVAPFSVFSSSAGNTTLAVAANKEITNLHHDGYGDFKEKPLQGPFTEKYVGGQQHRHVGLTTPIRTSTSSIPGFAAADYNQPMSHGDRTAEITVTYSPPFGAARQLLFEGALAPHFYSSLCLVDAVETISSCDGTFFNSGTPLAASYIRFDFGAGNKQRITELRWTQDRIDAQGQWKVQGSNDAIAWTDVSTVQTLGGGVDDSVYGAPYYSTPLSLDLIGATDTYRYYQLLYDNGVVVNAPDVSPVDFKISPRLLLYRLPNETERAEGFRLKVDSEIVSLMQPEKDSAGNINLNLPRARYYRDEVAKRPLNIRNIHQTTGSTIIGNYDEIYQVVQTSNRRANNQWWVDNETDVILYDENSFSLQTISPTPFAPCCVGPEIGWNDYAKPQRGKTPHVFVERFSSPGGPGTAGDSDGGVGLDVLSAEYSVYSTMNYRNTSVRQALNEFSTEHAAQFGVDPDDSTAAAFHKTNRNGLKRIKLSGGTIITGSVYDNFYIQHAIPRSDMGYAWITASAISAPLGYATDASKLVSNPETITFLSASDFGSFVFTAPSTQRALGGSLSILGYWAGLGVADPNSFIPTDFIGLNTNIYEPITSSDNFLGYPSFVEIAPWKYTYMGGEVVVLTEPPLGIGVATMLNNILLHRNGPYQYPMWKQIRTGEHPVARHQRNNNRIDYIIPAQADSLVPSLQGQVRRIIRPPVKKTFIEPALSSKHSPLRHTLLVDTTLEDDESENRTLIVRHTYGNNLGYFANVELNNNLKKMDGTLLEENPIRQVYNDITDLYIRSSADMERSNPVKKFISLRYRETVYPKEYNAFLNRTRSRTEYDVLSILKWNSVRATRAELGATNSQGQTLPPQTSSIWPVDGRFSGPETFDGLIPSAAPNSFINGRTLRLQSDDGITIDPLDPYYLTGLDGSGELLNDYVQFHRGDFTTIKPGVLYARRDTYYSESPAKVNSSVIYVTGDAKWEAPAQSGKKPFYDTYDDFADHIKRIGKDYSIVPEFRISDHLDYYMSSQGGNFLSSLPNNEFSVDGALLSSSAQSDNIENRKFYQVYSHSDFLKHFDVIEADHKDVNSIGAAAGIRLVCKGIKKFRPREGFYPAQRTLQLAQLFSQSYGPHIDYSGPTFLALSAYSSLAHDSFRTFLQPFFAPGILYNTIKSGVAVDYPIKRVSEFSGGEALFVNPGTGSFRSNSPEKRFCVFPDFTVDAPRSCAEDSPWEKFVDSSETEYFQEARYTGRIPFEAILEPEKFVTDTFIRDNEVHTASLIACDTRLVDAPYSPLYKMATNNFFAETANFYLKNKGFAAMTSRSDRDSGNLGVVKVGGDFKEYQMDVVLTNMAANTVDDVVNYGQWDRTGPEKSIVMYDRSLAFGPGCLVTSSWEDNWVDPDSGAPSYVTASIVETSPFTPPYYGGYAKIRLKFKPTKFDYTIPELIGELTSSCFRAGHWEDPATATGVGILDAMQITASINILDIDKCLISDKLVEYAEDGTVQTVKEDPNAGNIWVIEPKFETPVLDFKYVDVTRPTEFEVIGPAVVPATGSSGRFSVPKGMWHQYGQIPSGSEGIFLQIKDVSNSEVDDEFLTGSLADLVGFDKGRRNRRIGELPFDLSVSEAVVAVPFYEGADEEMQFLPIHRTQISNAKDELAGQLDPMSSVGNSIVQMVKRMQKYVFPPKMDFLKYENVEPFAMYIFEFTHTFSRQDLADMWQNLSPKIGTEFQAATSTIQHKILEKELVDQNQISGGGRGGNLRWLVFKVKQKAKTNYYEMTLGGATLADRFNIDLPGRFDTAPDFSYNWPYDYFSLVELVKLDAEVEYMKKETNTETLTGPAGETLTTES